MEADMPMTIDDLKERNPTNARRLLTRELPKKPKPVPVVKKPVTGVSPEMIKRGEQAKAGAASLRKTFSTAPSVLKGYKESGIAGGRGKVPPPALKTLIPNVMAPSQRTPAVLSDSEEAGVSRPLAPTGSPRPSGSQRTSFGKRMQTRDQRATARLKAFDKDLAVSGRTRQAGNYEVSGMTSGEFERFNRAPVHGGQRQVSGALRGGSVRPEGGWAPRVTTPFKEQMPKFDAPGFTGADKAARIHSQKQQWLEERRGAADASKLAEVGEAGQTARTSMREAGATARTEAASQSSDQLARTKADIHAGEKMSAQKQALVKSKYDNIMKGYGEGAKWTKDAKGENVRETHEEFLRRFDSEVADVYYGKKAKAVSAEAHIDAML